MGSFPLYPAPIPDNAIDLTAVPTTFEQDLSDNLGSIGSNQDGFDLALLSMTQYVTDHPSIMAGLDDALGGAAATLPQLDTPFHQDFSDTLAGFITQGDPDFQQYNVDVTGNNPPPPPPPPSGGKTPTGPTQSAKCGTYGASQILLSDDTTNVDAANVLPVVNIQDGTCTFIFLANGSDFMGKLNISATALKTGDAKLFDVSNDTIPAAQAGVPPTSRFIVTLTPYQTGHFQARFNVTGDRFPTRPEVWWMAVDVINQGTGSGGSGGGGTGGGGSGGGGTGGGGGRKGLIA